MQMRMSTLEICDVSYQVYIAEENEEKKSLSYMRTLDIRRKKKSIPIRHNKGFIKKNKVNYKHVHFIHSYYHLFGVVFSVLLQLITQ